MPQATTGDDTVRPGMNTARWFFNPFIRIDSARALLIGLSVIVASGPVAAFGGLHFDGLPDFTPTYGAPLWVPIGEGLVTWFVFSLLVGFVARVLASRPVRFVDIAGPQALARFPLLVAGCCVRCRPCAVRTRRCSRRLRRAGPSFRRRCGLSSLPHSSASSVESGCSG